MSKRIGFLFNHDANHQVAHLALIIVNLKKLFPQFEVVALVSSESQQKQLEELTARSGNRSFEIINLATPGMLKPVFKVLNNIAPLQRLFILRQYRSVFQQLDCLVVPELTSTLLKTHLGVSSTPLVLLPHGAGDRAVGFSNEIRYFDYVLLPGSKVRDRMLENGLIRKDNHSIIGYPKFDTINTRETRMRKPYFNNDKPVVLYNPHFDPVLSSWYQMGMQVLEFFAAQADYNLVVAPHVMLYKKKFHYSLQSHMVNFVRTIPAKYRACENIHIDLGSSDCVNMSYTLSADIYLGDVSSQIYEFLLFPRPCVFLNTHCADWKDDPNYYHWHCGPVIKKITELPAVLGELETSQLRYYKTQKQHFAETFDLNTTSSSIRAAHSIAQFLNNRPQLLAA